MVDLNYDWDNATAQNGVVHDAIANTDYTSNAELLKGYDYANFSEITPDPVLCLPLHEDAGSTAYDVAGTNDGTVSGAGPAGTGTVTGPFGATTTAYSFDGTDDRVNFGDLAVTDFGTGPFSAALWFKTTDTNGQFITQRNTNSGWVGWTLDLNSGDVRAVTDDGGTSEHIIGASGFNDGAWHHAVMVRGGGTLRLYIDGVERASTTDSYTVSASTPFSLGAVWNEANNAWTAHLAGDLADARVYDTTLSPSQVQAMYDVVATDGTLTTSWKTA